MAEMVRDMQSEGISVQMRVFPLPNLARMSPACALVGKRNVTSELPLCLYATAGRIGCFSLC